MGDIMATDQTQTITLTQCPFREDCWNTLNASAIEADRDTPGRKFPCGFEQTQSVARCPRKARLYTDIGSEVPFVQLTIGFIV